MNKLQEYADKNNLNHNQIAKDLGLTRQTIKKICSIQGVGVLHIRAKTLELIRRVYKINMLEDITTQDIQKEKITYKFYENSPSKTK